MDFRRRIINALPLVAGFSVTIGGAVWMYNGLKTPEMTVVPVVERTVDPSIAFEAEREYQQALSEVGTEASINRIIGLMAEVGYDTTFTRDQLMLERTDVWGSGRLGRWNLQSLEDELYNSPSNDSN